jgi:hypothetical protein
MTAYIGYDNHLANGTVTVTSEESGYPKENAWDWLLTDWWKANAPGVVYVTVDMGAAVNADYWAIAGHNLHLNSGNIKPQYSSDNFSSDIHDFDSQYTPSNGNPYLRKVTQRNARYFRFLVNSIDVASLIGQLCIGNILELPSGMPAGFIPPSLAHSDEVYSNVSDGGQFIGRSVIRNGKRFTISQEVILPSWFDNNWQGLYDHIVKKPFFFAWDYENYQTDITFCWSDGNIDPPRYSSTVHMNWSMKVRGV